MAGERKNYLLWSEFFMSITSLVALRGTNNYSGACIVDRNNHIMSVGFANDILDETSNDYYISALSNALYKFRGRRQEFEGSTVYLTNFPNCEESRQLAQARVKQVNYMFKDVPADVERVSEIILSHGGVEILPYCHPMHTKEEYKEFLNQLKKVIKDNVGKGESPNLTDDEFFMGIVGLSALRSKDPSTQVGSCLVDSKNRILSIGYNGAPCGMSDVDLPWDSIGEKSGDLLNTKDPYIVHAEINAFDNYRGNQDDLYNSQLYLMYSPCLPCTNRISMSGLKRVIYLREYTKNNTSARSRIILNSAGTIYEPYYSDKNITKEDCSKFLDETTKVVKKSLSKHISKNIYLQGKRWS